METLELQIVKNCSGKTYKSLVENYGTTVDSMLRKGYITLHNGRVILTEIGIQLSKPTEINENYKQSNLLID